MKLNKFLKNDCQIWPELGPNWKYSSPKSTRSTFPVARARPGPKPKARNPTRARKKVARPSPNPVTDTEYPIWMGWNLKSYCGFVFGEKHFPPLFLWWKNVYILILGPSYDLAHFSNFQLNPNLKNEQNHREDPLKK